MINAVTLVAAGIPAAQAQRFEAPLQAACARFGIDTPARMAAFVAQCAHESRNFTALEEGLFYRSADRIRAIFPSRVPSVGAAQALVGNPQALANCVYAGRNGNGDEASGDGFRYRGRGLIQLTGRANYERAARALARDYVATPDLVAAADDACLTAGWFWDAGKLNALADAGRFDAITRAVNGPAMAGAAERRELFERALKAFAPEPAAATRGKPAAAGVAVAERAAPKQARPSRKAAPSKAQAVPRKGAAAKPAASTKPAAAAKPAASKKPAASRTVTSGKPAASKRAVPSTKRAAPKKAAAAAERRPAAKKRASPAKRAAATRRAAPMKRAAATPRAPSSAGTPARKRTAAPAKRRAPAAKARGAKAVRA